MSDFTMLSGAQGWTPGGVDSQKNRPDASEIPGLAPPNTQCARRNRKNNDLAACGESFCGAIGFELTKIHRKSRETRRKYGIIKDKRFYFRVPNRW